MSLGKILAEAMGRTLLTIADTNAATNKDSSNGIVVWATTESWIVSHDGKTYVFGRKEGQPDDNHISSIIFLLTAPDAVVNDPEYSEVLEARKGLNVLTAGDESDEHMFEGIQVIEQFAQQYLHMTTEGLASSQQAILESHSGKSDEEVTAGIKARKEAEEAKRQPDVTIEATVTIH